MRPLVRFEFPDDFPFEPTVNFEGGRRRHSTIRPIPIWVELWDGRRFLLCTIPQGFETDGISRPRWARWFFKPWGEGYWGAVLHDYFLWLRKQGVVGAPKMLIDVLFLMAAVSAKTSFLRAALMFGAVRTRT